ncbi:Antirestriction protein (ArdA) [Lachnospiraceae bacterium NLAE-zl-G231]|uniref:YodL domain-containing protein n=1 Tax=Enterocloster bolteae TaxID=208479 RepID=UPI0008E58E94|nr:Antirestriction protein (ArdA) [Lachnospiraceae bacterium NLAE-zl-G231]
MLVGKFPKPSEKKGAQAIEKEKIQIESGVLLIDTRRAFFDMQAIENRRFLYEPQTRTLILGYQFRGKDLASSHAEEHADSGASEPFDRFIRGWVGTGREYKDGVIHFAPNIDGHNTEQFDRAFSTLEMFRENNANGKTVIRGFGDRWEQPLSNLIPERSDRMSEVFSIQIHNRKLFEQGEQGVWVELPTTTEKLQEAMRQVGISADNPQDFFINGYSCPEDRRLALPYDMVLAADVDELNYLAARLEPLSAAEIGELNAAAQSPRPLFKNIGQIIDYPDNIDYFVHIPNVSTPSELGDYYLHKSGMVEMPEEWKGGIDPYPFGTHIAKQEQGQFTLYGYLVKSGDEWQRVHEGQPVPEQYRVMAFPPPQADRAEMKTGQAAALTEPQPAAPFILKGKTKEQYMKEITDRLENGIQELMDSDRYKSYLTSMSKFHSYSFRNTMLIHIQKPDASLVAGLTKWETEFERTRKKGERGLKILAPKPYTTRKQVPKLDPATGQPVIGTDGKPVTEEKEITVPNFIVVSVYDISQTEGKEVPDINMNVLDGDVEQYSDFLSALEQSTPYSFAIEEINTGSNGYCNYENQHIGIKAGMSQLQTVETAIHEVTHARLYEKNRKLPDKKQPDKATREVQAESVAFAVCQYFGLDTSGFSFGYIADWGSGRDMKELKASLETIRATANELINEIEGHFIELQKQREADLQHPEAENDTPEPPQAMNDTAQEAPAPEYIYQVRANPYKDGPENGYLLQAYLPQENGRAKMGDVLYTGTMGKCRELMSRLLSGELTQAQIKEQNKKTPEPEQPTFTIYQLKHGEELRDYRFEPYERLQATNLTVDPANYEQVYIAPLEIGMTLESIYEKFNIDHPADFRGHSLSVSDVVVLHQDGKDTAHYCDSFGFQDVPEFLQERQAVQEQEAVYQIGDNYLYIQTCENGYDYTLYDATFQPGDGGQLDNPALTFEGARDEIAAMYEMSGQPCEAITAADFEKMQEVYNQQPTVTINFSENRELENGDILPYGRADLTFERLDREARAERDDPDRGRYYKTDFTITYMMDGQLYEYNGRQDFGDGDGTLSDHIKAHAEHYRNDPQYQGYLASEGKQAEENEGYDFVIDQFVPYLKFHTNLSELEQLAKRRVEELQAKGIVTPEDNACLNYYTDLQTYVVQTRIGLNTASSQQLPTMPKLDDYLKAAEMTLEQNTNMIDGVLNNMPTASEREDREKAGEPQADTSTPTAPAEHTEEPSQTEQGTTARYYPINETAARRAKEANSFSDYRPGSATAEYRQYVDEAVEIAERQKKRVDPEYHEKIDYLLDLYCRKLAENMNHRFAIDARVPSVLIAGPANFPVRQKEKQNAARDSNMEEWQHIRGLLDKIRSTGMGGISADDPQAVKKLEDKLEKLEQLQETMKTVNAYYRKHKTLDGCPGLSAESIDKIKAGMASSWRTEPKPFESYELSNNNQEIHRIRDRIQVLTRRAELGYVGWEFDGGRVEANQPDNRLQIFFDEKPDASTRETLKGNGFRWSPKAGAWQRQLNDNAIYAADRIKCIQPLTGETPTQLQVKARKEKEKPSIRAKLKAEKATPEPKRTAPEKSQEMEVG